MNYFCKIKSLIFHKKEHSEFKTIIGEVFLEKTPSAKTVVAKNDTLNVSVENKFRILPFEIIAGENSLDTTHVEHGNRFQVNVKPKISKFLSFFKNLYIACG